MSANSPSERLARHMVGGCALAGGLLALMAIAARVGGRWSDWISDFVRPHFSIALHTACLLALLGAALWVHNRWPGRWGSRLFGGVAAAIVAIFSLLALARLWFPIPIEFEGWVVGLLAPAAPERVGHISPHTALTFLWIAGALGLLLNAPTAQVAGGWRRWTAFWLAAVALASGLVAALGFAIGTPLIYGFKAPSMRWLAAVIVVLLSTGLMLAAFPRNWLLLGLLGESDENADAQSIRFRRRLVVLLAVLMVGMGGMGFYYLRKEQAGLRARVEQELAIIADLKVAQLTDWRRARLREANLVRYTPYVARRAADAIAMPKHPQTQRMFTGWLESFLATGPYEELVFVDRTADVILVHPPREGVGLSEAEREAVGRAVTTRNVSSTDLHQSAEDSVIRLSLAVPLVLHEPPPHEAATAQAQVMGVLMLRADAHQTLFTLLRSWPTASPTLEMYLVREDDGFGIYLSDLRYHTNEAFGLRFPLTQTIAPAAVAVLGQQAVMRGRDYRRVPVLAVTRRIPNTPWSLVAQMDEQEIYAPARERGVKLGIVVALLMLGVAVGFHLLWRQRDLDFLRRQVTAEHERFVLAQRLAHVMQHANDVIILTDDQWRIQEVNDRGLELYSYSLAELRRMRTLDLRAPATRKDFPLLDAELRRRGHAVAQTVHQSKHGATFPVEISVRKVELDGDRHILAIVRDVTERQRAEQALRDSESRYRSLVDAAQDTVFTATVDGRFTSLNPAFETYTGWPRADWLGRNFAELVHPDDLPLAQEMAARVAAGQSSPLFEVRVRKQSGDCLIVQILATPRLRDGQVEGLLGIARDVTARKQAEEEIRRLNASLERRVRERTAELETANAALRESEAQLRLALSASEAGAWSWEVKTNRADWDDHYHQQYGFAPGQPRNMDVWLSRLHPDDRERLQQRIQTLLSPGTGDLWNEDFRVLHPVSGVRWMTQLGRVERGPDGRAVRFAGINLDTTERKRAEEALRLSEARNRLLSERTFEGIVIHEHGRIVDCNLSFAQLFGYETRELIGSDGFELLAPEARNMVRGQIESEVATAYETTGLRKDGSTFPMEIQARMITLDERRLRFGSCRDITERKRVEEEIRRLNTSLEQRVRERTAELEAANEHLKRLQEQLVEVSDREQERIGQDMHDSLCQVLVGTAFDLNRLEQALATNGAGELEIIRRACDALDTAITQARNVARGLVAVQLGGDGLAPALQELAAGVTARYRIACQATCPETVPVTDHPAATHLFRIAQEAVNNAVKHAHPRHIAIVLAVHARQIVLTVTDDGEGLSPAAGRPGGMGLHIMEYRARALNGTLRLEPGPQRGTRVFCCVPRANV